MPLDEAPTVTRLPVKFKPPGPEGRTLLHPVEVPEANDRCDHYFGARYIVDEAKDHVECSKCHATLNPMWVLKKLTVEDSKFQAAAKRYQAELAELGERTRTKCQHCKQMTRITRR